MTLSSSTFPSLEEYIDRARIQIRKSGLKGEKWFIACLLNGIPDFDYHSVVHDKDPQTFEEAVKIVLEYKRTSETDHNQLQLRESMSEQSTRKRKASIDIPQRTSKRLMLQQRKKKGQTKNKCSQQKKKVKKGQC